MFSNRQPNIMIAKVSKPTQGRPSANNTIALGALTLLWMLLCIGCQKSSEPNPVFLGVPIGSNTLSAGDVISVAFPEATQLSLSQKIRLDGMVSLPMVGEVVAAGKSPMELQAELSYRYKKDLQDPKVIVSLVSSAALVYVNGEVRSPGKVLLDREMTVFDAIMESGGFSELANRKKVTVIRQEGKTRQTHVLNMKDDQGSAVFYVKPYDTITVSQSRF
jgi:polysaccharide export outer membrane protein